LAILKITRTYPSLTRFNELNISIFNNFLSVNLFNLILDGNPLITSKISSLLLIKVWFLWVVFNELIMLDSLNEFSALWIESLIFTLLVVISLKWSSCLS